MKQLYSTYLSLLIVSLLAIGCHTGSPSSEEFVMNYMAYLMERDYDNLYSRCYVQTKEDFKKMVQTLSGSNTVDDNYIQELHEASVRKRKDPPFPHAETWSTQSTYSIDSISTIPRKIPSYDGPSQDTKTAPLSDVHAYVTIDNLRYKLVFYCLDLQTGAWKIARHPVVTTLGQD